MREIKFRAKRVDDGMWVYGYYREFDGMKNEVHFISYSIIDRDGEVYEIDLETLGQLVGSRDKNDKEIYEGDIVKIDDRQIGAKDIYIGEVYYCTDYTLESNPCFAVWTKKGHIQLSPSIEIIGNIYENLKLLKEAEKNGKYS